MRNFCNLIGLEQWDFSLIWNTYMWKLPTFCGYKRIIAFVRDIWHKYHSWYFKIVSNFTRLTAREITYNNFEVSHVVVMPNITPNHVLLPIQIMRSSLIQLLPTSSLAKLYMQSNWIKTICRKLRHDISKQIEQRTHTGISTASSLLLFFGTRLRRQNFNLAPTQYRQLRRLVKFLRFALCDS